MHYKISFSYLFCFTHTHPPPHSSTILLRKGILRSSKASSVWYKKLFLVEFNNPVLIFSSSAAASLAYLSGGVRAHPHSLPIGGHDRAPATTGAGVQIWGLCSWGLTGAPHLLTHPRVASPPSASLCPDLPFWLVHFLVQQEVMFMAHSTNEKAGGSGEHG